MKAVVVSAIGGPEALVLRDVADPVPAAGEILVKVRYSGINYAETLVRRGLVPAPPAPFVLGLEIVGTVAVLGDGVADFAVGQPVAAFARSGYAQYAVVPAPLAVPLDRPGCRVDPAQAIGVPCTGVTAHQLLTLVGRLSKGDTVFVQGAGGGVGTMLGQQAKALGAGRVIGSVGSASKAAFVLAHGYDEAIVYEGYLDRLRAATGGRGVDLYLEGISGRNLAAFGSFLAPLGRAVYFGDTSFSSETEIAIQHLRAGSWTISGYSLGGLCETAPRYWRPSALAVLGMMADGAIHDAAVTMFAPAEAARAHGLLESRQSRGKLGLDWSML
ncbi:zinc-binding alcohol dehydrogenase family protein [Zavarzinia sp.]|uniref:quinone oxidoreductase family protein n=1 Tax=Zavarzinia sp. TaxID=2027920 RepID=UPI003566EA84